MRARLRMVEKQIAGRGIRDPAVLDAMRLVPREMFVEKGFEMFAYNDCPLPIGKGQTISQPYMAALMIEAAEVKRDDTVLEIGAGLGYATAILSRIAARVIAVERHASLAAGAAERLHRLGYRQCRFALSRRFKGMAESCALRRHPCLSPRHRKCRRS